MLAPMTQYARDIVVVGGSAGAIPALTVVIGVLQDDFPAAMFVSLHRAPQMRERDELALTLSSKTRLAVSAAHDNQPIQAGHVYITPGDEHMVLENGVIRLQHSPREHRFRPCIDVLFKSAASMYGRRVAGVLLSGGFGIDGVAGLWQINHRGGVTIIQDPADALFGAMPQSAIDNVTAHYILPASEIGPTLAGLASGTRDDHRRAARILVVEDESVVAANLQESLIEMGYDAVDWVPSGEAAIDLAEREHPDLILMDIRLSGRLSGIEAARQIWQRLQIPVVYCTAHSDPDTLTQVQTTESYGYLVKPFQSGAVRAAVELALARREKELR